MIIDELELCGFKRIALSCIERICITPTNAYQIFLGGNGCGKSSILDEWSPLPPNDNDFYENGFKRCSFRHNEIRYTVLSTMGKKKHHSFIRHDDSGDVELNEGGTISVQRELCQQLFNLNREMFDLLLGKSLFTEMSPTVERRSLITRMSADDLTFATKFYNQMASAERDAKGALAHAHKRLTAETDKLLALNADDSLESDVDAIQSDLTSLLELKRPQHEDASTIEQKLHHIYTELERVIDSSVQHPFYEHNTNGYMSSEAIRDDLNHHRTKKQMTVEVLNNHVQDYEAKQKFIETFNQLGESESPDELYQRKAELESKRDTLLKRIKLFTFSGDVSRDIPSLQTFRASVLAALGQIPDNSDKQFSRTNLNVFQQKHQQLNDERASLMIRLNRIDEYLDHVKHAHQNNCPKCGYVWTPGVDVSQHQRHVAERGELIAQLKVCETALEDTSLSIDKIHYYIDAMRRLKVIFNDMSRSHNLLDYILGEGRIYNQPAHLAGVVDVWVEDMYIHHELNRVQTDMQWVVDALALHQQTEGVDATAMKTSLQLLEETIGRITHDVHELQFTIDVLERLYKEAMDVERLDQRRIQLDEERVRWLSIYENSVFEESRVELVRYYQHILAQKTVKLNEKRSLTAVISDLKKDTEELEQTYQGYKLAAKALSPVDGLIAKQMIQFIEVIVDHMNEIISAIWTTPLVIKVCSTEDKGLNYKFPIEVGVEQNRVSDVSEASKGQKEIINFAFRLVAILYLGFDDFPLYLDEVGQNFDETHEPAFMNYVKMLVDAHRHSQLVMVSHSAAFYGAFNAADFCVLSQTNITVPSHHNAHVVMS